MALSVAACSGRVQWPRAVAVGHELVACCQDSNELSSRRVFVEFSFSLP